MVGAVLAAWPAHAALPVEYPSLVAAFSKACLEGPLTVDARDAAIAASGWRTDTASDVDVSGLAKSQAIEVNFDYSKPESVKQWSQTIDGARVRLVLATFPPKRRYPVICAVVVPGVRGAMPYFDEFRTAVRATGLKPKSTDMPHYLEFSGKVDGTHPVRAEIFSRSRSVPDKDGMHLYVAF
ncbi:hypothetical protein [Sphingomonas sp.]|uniref:hypothetical protein n=1 Tax=Sphingomonas sp. TaxID=28214 RepID=UPI000DB3EE3F|nr:hypothetical protein [Sphingomonas sp.]PZU09556.1 MAG: hypothetical protein DI605_07705 [Sphingomonas sp.]